MCDEINLQQQMIHKSDIINELMLLLLLYF